MNSKSLFDGWSCAQKTTVGAVFLVAIVLCVVGWSVFYFTCDDAYIAFRYVSNRQLGHGYVWNPPPFHPVEGFTSLLWVLILDASWSWLGVRPPIASTTYSLVFSLGTLVLTGLLTFEAVRRVPSRWHQVAFIGGAILATVTNKTFLMWTSSGLETALFNFLVHLWVFCSVQLFVRGKQWLWGLSVAAALLHLARPSGLLFLVATLAIAGHTVWQEHSETSWGHLYRLAPLLSLPGKFGWRYVTYGEWWPNTYFAKVTGWWTQAAWRYGLAFVLEYTLWMWIGMLAVGVWAWWRSDTQSAAGKFSWRATLARRDVMVVGIVGLTLVGHISYFLAIGGDHFEYRMLSYLIPLIFVTFIWGLFQITSRAWLQIATFGGFWIASMWIPWTYWGLSLDREVGQINVEREPKIQRQVDVPVLNTYVSAYDRLQDWLQKRAIGIRHHYHRLLSNYFQRIYPPRSRPMKRGVPEDNPVILGNSVGVLGWRFPHVHILDPFGLNDYVVARTPVECGTKKKMAHDRSAPPGYIRAMDPSYIVDDQTSQLREGSRSEPLRDKEIRQTQRVFRKWLRQYDPGDCWNEVPPPPPGLPNQDSER